MPLRSLKWVFWAALALAPAASAVMPLDPGDMTGHPHYRVGQPYKIGGVWYYPKEDWSYDETGIASWYGKPFQGRHTADGETFNLKGADRRASHPADAGGGAGHQSRQRRGRSNCG